MKLNTRELKHSLTAALRKKGYYAKYYVGYFLSTLLVCVGSITAIYGILALFSQVESSTFFPYFLAHITLSQELSIGAALFALGFVIAVNHQFNGVVIKDEAEREYETWARSATTSPIAAEHELLLPSTAPQHEAELVRAITTVPTTPHAELLRTVVVLPTTQHSILVPTGITAETNND